MHVQRNSIFSANYRLLCTVLHPPLRPRLPSMQPGPAHPPNLTKGICRKLPHVRQDCTPGSMILPVILNIRQPWFLRHSVLGEMSAIPGKAGCLFALTLRTRMPLCTHLAYPEASLHSPCVPGGLHCESGPLNVSYARQDCTPGSVILPVILYIRQPCFLMHSVLGEVLAMPSRTGRPFALTLRTRRLSLCNREVVRIGRW